MPDPSFWIVEREALLRIIVPILTDAALDASQHALDGLVNTYGLGVDWGLVNTAVRDWAKSYGFDLVSRITDTSARFLQAELSTWMQSGEALPKLIAAIEPMFGATRASMIAVTEVTRAFQAGSIETWKASGVVDGWEFRTAEDEIVCPECEPLDEQVFPLDDEDHQPPLHVNCRCFGLPVVNL
jgi:SPP1 gp7 family putative phage head morphogenesis protein